MYLPVVPCQCIAQLRPPDLSPLPSPPVPQCSDENWWRGESPIGQGLFPASFVSKDLNIDPEPCECIFLMHVNYLAGVYNVHVVGLTRWEIVISLRVVICDPLSENPAHPAFYESWDWGSYVIFTFWRVSVFEIWWRSDVRFPRYSPRCLVITKNYVSCKCNVFTLLWYVIIPYTIRIMYTFRT